MCISKMKIMVPSFKHIFIYSSGDGEDCCEQGWFPNSSFMFYMHIIIQKLCECMCFVY